MCRCPVRCSVVSAPLKMEPHTATEELAPRSLLHDFDRMMNALASDHLTNERLRDFVRLVYRLVYRSFRGGPTADDLIVAIESGRVDGQAVAYFLYGMPFDSWTEPPPGES